MKVEVKDKSPIEKTLSIEVEPERYEKTLSRIIRDVGREIQIPGFRKGKAPAGVIIRRVGMDALKKDLLDKLIPEVTREVVEEKNLTPLSTPVCTNYMEIDFKRGEPINFDVDFEVVPEFELKGYKGLELVKIKEDIDVEEMVEKQIQAMLEQAGTMVPIEEERGIEKGDVALVDFESYKMDGTPVEGGSSSNYYMTVEESNFIPGFMEHILGKKPGDEWEFEITFPEGYADKKLAGEKVKFEMKLHDILKKELPERDDEFARSTGDYETFEQLKEDIEEEVKESIEIRQRSQLQGEILSKLVKQIEDVPLPPTLVRAHLNRFIENLKNQLKMYGKSLEEHLQSQNLEMVEFKKQFIPQAENAARAELILDKISEVENVKVTEEEIDREIEKFARRMQQDFDVIKKAMKQEKYIANIEYDLRNRKIFDLIIDSAIITEKTREQVEREKEEEKKLKMEERLKKLKEIDEKTRQRSREIEEKRKRIQEEKTSQALKSESKPEETGSVEKTDDKQSSEEPGETSGEQQTLKQLENEKETPEK